MPRSREFDEEAVLTGAMGAFRRKGYRGVSIKDLESATRIKGGSIYNSFGDKAGVFAAAFETYLQAVLMQRIATHAPPQAGMAGVRALFVSLPHEPNDEAFGCLITNAAVEFGGDSDAPPNGVARGLAILCDTFSARLAAAQVTARSGPAPSGLGLLALYQGILVLVRAGYDKAELRTLIDTEFDRIEAVA